MPAPEANDPASPPVRIIQPCSEACACFQSLRPGGGWSDFGFCTNPRSPHHGTTVRLGLECRDYQSTTGTPQSRQA